MKKKETSKKIRIFRWFCAFMAGMAVCGGISRGIYSLRLARVETGTANMQGITHTITGTGTISGGREHPIYIKEGLRAEEVCVEAGEMVTQGTLLVRLDMEELEKQLEAAKKVYEEEQTRLGDLKNNRARTNEEAARDKERANADLNRITADQDAVVANAQNEYDMAYVALAEYPSFEAYLEAEAAADAQYQQLKQAAQKEGEAVQKDEAAQEDETAQKDEATQEDEAAQKEEEEGAAEQFLAYQEAFEKSKRESWETQRAALEEALREKEAALAQAQRERGAAVESASRQAMDAGAVSSDEASLFVQQNVVDAAKDTLDEYQKLVDGKGEILSKYEGTIQQVALVSGGYTAANASFVIADGGEGWDFAGEISEEDRNYIKNGDEILLELPDSDLRYYHSKITTVAKNGEGRYEVHVKLEEPGLFWGESGSFTIEEENQESNCRVPLSALYAENNSVYVLIIEEENTFLGTELRAVRKDVSVLDKNEMYALLQEGSLTSEEKMIVSSDRPVAPNDRVRLEEP